MNQETVNEARKLLISITKDFIKDSPLKDKYLYGSDLDLSRQYLKPLWDVCNEAEKAIEPSR